MSSMVRLTMISLQGLVIVGVLWNYNGVHGFDCQNAITEILECFPGSMDLSIFTSARLIPALARICNSERLSAFKTEYRCAANVISQCPKQMGLQSPEYTIDPDTAVEGLNYICQHSKDIDLNCLSQTLPEMSHCVQMKLVGYQNTTDVRVCMMLKMAQQCISEVYRECSGKTKDVILHFLQNYNVPPACRGCMNTVSPLLLLLVFLLTCVHGACAEL